VSKGERLETDSEDAGIAIGRVTQSSFFEPIRADSCPNHVSTCKFLARFFLVAMRYHTSWTVLKKLSGCSMCARCRDAVETASMTTTDGIPGGYSEGLRELRVVKEGDKS
jgi:hypothetical protein